MLAVFIHDMDPSQDLLSSSWYLASIRVIKDPEEVWELVPATSRHRSICLVVWSGPECGCSVTFALPTSRPGLWRAWISLLLGFYNQGWPWCCPVSFVPDLPRAFFYSLLASPSLQYNPVLPQISSILPYDSALDGHFIGLLLPMIQTSTIPSPRRCNGSAGVPPLSHR